jgi:hypothetical protein
MLHPFLKRRKMSEKYKGWTDEQLKAEARRIREEMRSPSPARSKEYYRNELRALSRMLEIKNRRF